MKKSIFILIGLSFVSCTSSLKKTEVLPGHSFEQHRAESKNIMITSQGEYTTKAAKYIQAQGGNLFDMAVAMSFVISVERPHSTGLGGGGFLLAYQASENKTTAFDFRETAPIKSYKKMFLTNDGKQITDKSRTGAFAVAVPGLVQGVLSVHEKYGSLPLGAVLKPAIDLASKGFKVYPALGEALKAKEEVLKKFPGSKAIFFNENGELLKEGDQLIQSDLANTLTIIAKKGATGFYRGEIAKKIVKSVQTQGGLMTLKDLRSYQVKKREPIIGDYKGYKIVSMPPPSSGGTHIIEILNILEGYDLKKQGAQNAKTIHLVSSAMQIAFADRAKYMGDSDFKKIPTKMLISKKYAEKLREKIPKNKALSSKDFPVDPKNIYESDDTTHFTIMDSFGNTITTTQTINGWFGSGMVAEGTGIVLNNEMDDFASHVGGVNLFHAIGGKNNLVEPRKRPLSSMSPTIVFKDRYPVLALGTPSGTRILTCVMQTVLNQLEFDMNLYDAVHATRYHHQWHPEEIRIGSPGFSKKTIRELESYGHKINEKDLGCKIQAVQRNLDGSLIGVSDNREEGLALGI